MSVDEFDRLGALAPQVDVDRAFAAFEAEDRRRRRRRRGLAGSGGLLVSALAVVALTQLPGGQPAQVTAGRTDEPLLGCGGAEPFFPASALEGPTNAEEGDDDAAAALRATLNGEDGNPIPVSPVPTTGWSRLVLTDDVALFVHLSTPEATVTYRRADGRWEWAGSSSRCGPRRVKPRFLGADWSPRDPVAPEDTGFVAMVTEEGCNGGAATEPDRILDPQIEYRPDAVVVTFFVKPHEGDSAFTCPGQPPTPVRVRLAEPLGNRKLLDGGQFPPEPPIESEAG